MNLLDISNRHNPLISTNISAMYLGSLKYSISFSFNSKCDW